MPNPETQEAPAAPEARASEGQGVSGWLSDKFTQAGLWAGSFFSDDLEVKRQQNNIRMSDTPGTDMLAAMATQEGFKPGQPGNAQLTAIQNDPAFMASLDKALASDTSILSRMAEAGTSGGMGPAQMIEQLGDPQNRALMTRVLNKVGEDANDGFGADYLSEVMGAAQAQDYAALDGVLEQGGISDTRVKMGATLGPLANIGSFLRDPNGATRSWINDPNGPFAGLSDDNKNMVAGLVQALAKFAGIYMPGNGIIDPYLDLGRRIGGELSSNGAELRGVANLPSPPTPDGGSDTVGAAGNPRTTTNLASTFNIGGLNQRGAEPDANTPSPQVARVENTVSGRDRSGQALVM